jgi:hypothetical protein
VPFKKFEVVSFRQLFVILWAMPKNGSLGQLEDVFLLSPAKHCCTFIAL